MMVSEGEVFITVMIHVIATIELHEGEGETFLAEFRNVVPQVLAEEGCLEYGPAVDLVADVAARLPARPDVVTVVEKWESVEHLKRHLIAPHMKEFRHRVKELVARTTLLVLTPV
jgi:quinol monooxygenase YgiN